VAKRAGVSPVTVSRVINTPSLVTEQMQAKVAKAVAELGYVPNLLAGGLASARSRAISVIVPGIYLSLFNDTLHEIVMQSAKAGYQVSVGFAGRSQEESTRTISDALSRRPDGLILMVTGGVWDREARERIIAADIPVVEAWDLPKRPIDMAVGYSIEGLSEEISRFIIDQGYERPFFLWARGPRGVSLRFGISQALIEAGREEPEHLQFAFPGQFSDGLNAIDKIAELDERPDLLLCMSDWVAHGAMLGARQRGWSVPKDIAICGFGDQSFAPYLEPSLTSIRIDGRAIGQASITMLLDRLQGNSPGPATHDVGFELIRRESA
jgi:LacI family gluconate utilization system Gnt-I transcriptional repressor